MVFLPIKLKFQWAILSKFNIVISVANGPFSVELEWTITMRTMTILFDHNIQIEVIIICNSLENQIINWSGDYY